MANVEKIEDFCHAKLGWLPDQLDGGIGHFNVFNLKPFSGENAKPVPYKQRDFYKITLIQGQAEVHYADKSVKVLKQALTFSNPLIPYKWEGLAHVTGGFFCIFNQAFFRQFGSLTDYSIFKPGGMHVFEISDAQLELVHAHFQRMTEEIKSEYIHKDDVLRTIVFELLHMAMKMQPSNVQESQNGNAAHRIAVLFSDLLERQFPIDSTHPAIALKTASDFAKQLNLHVNSLNRAVKEVKGKTTTEIIGERTMQEAKVLLKHTDMSVSEIAYCLGYSEPTHFNAFFKKHARLSPAQFRKV